MYIAGEENSNEIKDQAEDVDADLDVEIADEEEAVEIIEESDN